MTKPKFRVGQVVKVVWRNSSPEYLKIKTINEAGDWVDFTNGNCTTMSIIRPLTAREIGVQIAGAKNFREVRSKEAPKPGNKRLK